MSASTLLTDAMRDHIQEGINSAIDQVPQNTGVLGKGWQSSGRSRPEHGRYCAWFRTRTAVEVLERRTIPQEDAPARPDAWLKVRTSPTEVGWLLSDFVEFDVPEGIAPYTEDYVYSAVKTLNEIDDPVAGIIRWYVVGERRPGSDPELDFTGIRVFTWNMRKQRYETAFRKQGLRGVYPLAASRRAGRSCASCSGRSARSAAIVADDIGRQIRQRCRLDALAGERLFGDCLVAEMLERSVVEVMRGPSRVDQVAGDHRVEGETAQRHALSPEHQRRRLEVVPDFGDAIVGEHRAQDGHDRLQFQSITGVEQRSGPARHRHVPGRARCRRHRDSDHSCAQRRGAVGNDMHADAAGLADCSRPAPVDPPRS